MPFVSFKKNHDYENGDGTWTRYPTQVYIETDQRRQDAKDVLVLEQAAEIERLRTALEFYADAGNYCWDDDLNELVTAYQAGKLADEARRALAGQEGEG